VGWGSILGKGEPPHTRGLYLNDHRFMADDEPEKLDTDSGPTILEAGPQKVLTLI